MKQNDGNNLYKDSCNKCGNDSIEYVYGYWYCPNEDCPNNLLYRREDVLRTLWCEKGLTQPEIAERLHTSVRTVQRWIRRHGIEKTEHLETKFVNGYHILRHKDGEANRKVRIHRLVAVAEYGIDAVKNMEVDQSDEDSDGQRDTPRRMEVHHKNCHRWDNRPENLELLEPEEHGEVTWEQRYDRIFE